MEGGTLDSPVVKLAEGDSRVLLDAEDTRRVGVSSVVIVYEIAPAPGDPVLD